MPVARRLGRSLLALLALPLVACEGPPAAAPAPCYTIRGDSDLRAKDAKKTLDDLAEHIRLSPEDEQLRKPASLADIRLILRRDVVFLFPVGAAYARTLDTLDGRFTEAYLELLMGESQLVASQVLTTQAAWVGADVRIARASLASDQQSELASDRDRMLAQLVRVVEEGNKISDALGIVAPSHLSRGAEVIRGLRTEAPTDVRTTLLIAEYHRLRGEWTEFDAAMVATEHVDTSPALRYLRAMEQLERFRKPEEGAKILREALERYPKFIRAQAALVLMATNPLMALRELKKLKEMNEDHYLVALLEPTLAAEQQLLKMQNGAAPRAPR